MTLIGRRFEDILTGCQHLSGILLYLDEGNHVIMEMPGRSRPSDRVKAVVEAALSSCEKLDRRLIVTTFALMPHQAKAITDALKAIPPSPHLVVHNYACRGRLGTNRREESRRRQLRAASRNTGVRLLRRDLGTKRRAVCAGETDSRACSIRARTARADTRPERLRHLGRSWTEARYIPEMRSVR